MNQREPWRLDSSGAEIYERYRVPDMFGPLAQLLLARVALKPGQSVLDVACGTGIVARLAAERVGPSGRVSGLDCNASMLDVARANTPKSGAPVEWWEADAGELPFPDETFDVVLCQQGLQFIADRSQALRQMRRVLVASGRLGLCVWQSIEHNPYAAAVVHALARNVNETAADRFESAYTLCNAEDLRALVSAAGFQNVEIRAETLTRHMGPPEDSILLHLVTSGHVGGLVSAMSQKVKQALIADVTAALQPYRKDAGLAIPMGAFIVLARK